jgi:hypothetical protein
MKAHDVKAFFDKVHKLYTMKDISNPYMEETGDLFTLDTKIIAHSSVAEIVASQYDDGKTRFNEFSIRRSNVCLQNCCKLRFLTALEITIITQCSEKRLFLILKKLHQAISKTFEEYAVLEIVPKVQGYSCTYMRRYCV